MNIGKTMQDALNEQIKNELYSGYLYLAMSAYAESVNLPGFAHWMREQAGEEQEHAMKFFKFVAERGGRVVLHAIDQPPVEFASPIALFEETLAHERLVTSMIHKLFGMAMKEKDYSTQAFLKWYIDEQVEEEAHASEILEQLKMIGDNKLGLFQIDRLLAARS